MKSYICPACGEKQTSVREWQTISIAYDFDLASRSQEEADRSDSADFESFGCPSCGEDITDEKLVKQINKQLFGN
jgi:predicted RNA-binding Zn-ribbon protein involved in translation (DUF1610 family)